MGLFNKKEDTAKLFKEEIIKERKKYKDIAEKQFNELNNEWQAKYDNLEKVKDARIGLLYQEIDHLKSQLSSSQKMTEVNYFRAKDNTRIAVELEFQAKKFLDNASIAYKNVVTTHDEALKQLEIMEKSAGIKKKWIKE